MLHGGLPGGVNWGSCYNAGPLESDQGHKLVLVAEFQSWELLTEVPFPEARLDLGCVESLDTTRVPLVLDR